MPGRNMTEMYRIIEALMIVHNILEEYGDDPTTIAGFNGQEDEACYEGRSFLATLLITTDMTSNTTTYD